MTGIVDECWDGVQTARCAGDRDIRSDTNFVCQLMRIVCVCLRRRRPTYNRMWDNWKHPRQWYIERHTYTNHVQWTTAQKTSSAQKGIFYNQIETRLEWVKARSEWTKREIPRRKVNREESERFAVTNKEAVVEQELDSKYAMTQWGPTKETRWLQLFRFTCSRYCDQFILLIDVVILGELAGKKRILRNKMAAAIDLGNRCRE